MPANVARGLPSWRTMRTFNSLSEREILALAVSLEEEDERIYADFADGLRQDPVGRRQPHRARSSLGARFHLRSHDGSWRDRPHAPIPDPGFQSRDDCCRAGRCHRTRYYLLGPASLHGDGGLSAALQVGLGGILVFVTGVMKQETLAWTLRYKLGLTGTKLGCDRAECGACTVLLDDVPHYSCSVLTHAVRDQKVLTIEGLANQEGTLHPVQQGIIDEQGFQCAFCMSGFVMATVGFLKTNPNPTRLELAQGISGNLCRCQDYDKILTALMRGAANMSEVNHV